jgi:hypothetical protein
LALALCVDAAYLFVIVLVHVFGTVWSSDTWAAALGAASELLLVCLAAANAWALGPWSSRRARLGAAILDGVAALVIPCLAVLFADANVLYVLGLPVLINVVALLAQIRRRLPGHCAVCGYDLAANETGLCPECGTAPAA